MVQSRLEIFFEAWLVESAVNLVGRRLWVLVFLIVGCRVRIVQVYRNDVLLGLGLELMSQLVPVKVVVLDIETVLTIVLARSWQVGCLLSRVLADVVAHTLALEDIPAALHMLLDRVRLVLADTWGLLFEVDVDRNGLDVVEGIVFIEWKAEVAFVVHSRAWNVVLGLCGLVLPRTHVDARVCVQHLRGRLEACCFVIELLLLNVAPNIAKFAHFGL